MQQTGGRDQMKHGSGVLRMVPPKFTKGYHQCRIQYTPDADPSQVKEYRYHLDTDTQPTIQFYQRPGRKALFIKDPAGN